MLYPTFAFTYFFFFYFLGLAQTPSVQTSQYGNVAFAGDYPIVKKMTDVETPEVFAVNTSIDTTHEKHPNITLKPGDPAAQTGAGLIQGDQIESAFDHPKLLQFVGEIKGKERIPPKRKNDIAGLPPKIKKNKLLGGGVKFA